MSKWVERVTPQGRVYFCNLITQETTWSRDDIDPFTGHLVSSSQNKTMLIKANFEYEIENNSK